MSRRRIPGRISLGQTDDNERRNDDDDARMNHDGSNAQQRPPTNQCLPLSMQLLKYVPGMNCACCAPRQNSNTTGELDEFLAAAAFKSPHTLANSTDVYCQAITNQDNKRNGPADDNLLQELSTAHDYYDLHSLGQEFSATSPLVTAPMLLHSNHSAIALSAASSASRQAERMLHDYLIICRWYKVAPNAGAMTTLRFSLPSLRLTGLFEDADLLALAELLLHHANGPLSYIHRLDFSVRHDLARWHRRHVGIRSHGALALAKVLQSSRHIRELNLTRNPIGPYGASAIFIACASNASIHKLVLRRCRAGERGALVFAEWIGPSETCGLVDIDLSANFIGFKGSLAIERALQARALQLELPFIHVNLEGNLVLQEIMNGVTHGLGVLMAFAGSWLLYQAVQDKPSRHFVSCMVYAASLIVLYISSTLFHSFFILQHTKYIFEVLDKCAIYILIAGSYTPFLQIVLWNDAFYSVYLLTFIWVCGFLGIVVEAFFPTYRYKQFFSLAMYLGMGKWAFRGSACRWERATAASVVPKGMAWAL